MIKKILLSAVVALTTLSATADTLNVRTLFTEMPDSIMPYLTKNNRLDFIDFMDSNMKAEVTNLLGGKSLMTALTDDSLSLTMNESCTIDLLLLKTNESVDSTSQVLCLVRSLQVEKGEWQSSVEFYTLKWCKLSSAPSLVSDDEKRLSSTVKTLNIIELMLNKFNNN